MVLHNRANDAPPHKGKEKNIDSNCAEEAEPEEEGAAISRRCGAAKCGCIVGGATSLLAITGCRKAAEYKLASARHNRNHVSRGI